MFSGEKLHAGMVWARLTHASIAVLFMYEIWYTFTCLYDILKNNRFKKYYKDTFFEHDTISCKFLLRKTENIGKMKNENNDTNFFTQYAIEALPTTGYSLNFNDWVTKNSVDYYLFVKKKKAALVRKKKEKELVTSISISTTHQLLAEFVSCICWIWN